MNPFAIAALAVYGAGVAVIGTIGTKEALKYDHSSTMSKGACRRAVAKDLAETAKWAVIWPTLPVAALVVRPISKAFGAR